jgi:hypothetical protein
MYMYMGKVTRICRIRRIRAIDSRLVGVTGWRAGAHRDFVSFQCLDTARLQSYSFKFIPTVQNRGRNIIATGLHRANERDTWIEMATS